MIVKRVQFPNRDGEAQLNEVVAPRLEDICHQPLPSTCLNLHGRSIPCRPDTLPAGGFPLVRHYDGLPRTTMYYQRAVEPSKVVLPPPYPFSQPDCLANTKSEERGGVGCHPARNGSL
jgi:hypothetical protein